MPALNPVFICGAGRSGATLLYRLLCLNEQVGYLSNYDVRFAWTHLPSYVLQQYQPSVELKLMSWFEREGHDYFADKPWMKTLLPTPKEGGRLYSRCGLPTGSCHHLPSAEVKDKLRKTFENLQMAKGTAVILSKQATNNRRIPCLLEAFPEAKFIHLVRDGRAVAHSLSQVKWWGDYKLWWHDHQTPNQLQYQGEDSLGVAAKDWVKNNQVILDGLSGMNRNQVLEIHFETLLTDPHATTRLLFKFMGVPMTSGFKKALKKLDLHEKTDHWSDQWNHVQQYVVDEIQDEMLAHFGYK